MAPVSLGQRTLCHESQYAFRRCLKMRTCCNTNTPQGSSKHPKGCSSAETPEQQKSSHFFLIIPHFFSHGARRERVGGYSEWWKCSFWTTFRLLEIQSQCFRYIKKSNRAHLMLHFIFLMSHRARHSQAKIMSLKSVSQRSVACGLGRQAEYSWN